eukprot:TRINITY_DN4249_c1_g1_i3.p1 TRINITY_DN4249_c1_g1~~TRINITY_DN4249_c1_g1_i3.p1  ORF type:complete len:471 (-),score=65.41 TRINITY_DN4249_c1_g1_i3:86-1498(-)
MIIHHGKLYIFPSHICFLSAMNNCTILVPFKTITDINEKKLVGVFPDTVQVEACIEGTPTKYRFSHLRSRTETFKTLTAVWAHSKGDTSINLDELRSSRANSSVARDSPPLLASPSPNRLDVVKDEEIVMPPTWDGKREMPPHYSKGEDIAAQFPISLPQFWKLLFKSSLFGDAHTEKGDKNVKLGEWTPSAQEDGAQILSRTLSVEAEVRNPLVKGKICYISQTQYCWMIDKNQLVCVSESYAEGVPYAADFVSRTYWLASGIDVPTSTTTQQHVLLKHWVWITWIKTPFGPIKSGVEKAAVAGMKDYANVWVNAAVRRVQQALADAANGSDRDPSKGAGMDTSGLAGVPAGGASAFGIVRTGDNSSNSTGGSMANGITVTPSMLLAGLAALVLVLCLACVYFHGQMQHYRDANAVLEYRLVLLEHLRNLGLGAGAGGGGVDPVGPIVQQWRSEVARLQTLVDNLSGFR